MANWTSKIIGLTVGLVVGMHFRTGSAMNNRAVSDIAQIHHGHTGTSSRDYGLDYG